MIVVVSLMVCIFYHNKKNGGLSEKKIYYENVALKRMKLIPGGFGILFSRRSRFYLPNREWQVNRAQRQHEGLGIVSF